METTSCIFAAATRPTATTDQYCISSSKAFAERRERRLRAVWTRPWLERRSLYGQNEKLMRELTDEDKPAFRHFLRVEPAMFHELVRRLSDRISKKDTWYRKALEPALKIAITLRFLATGNSLKTLMYGFRVAYNTISIVTNEVCEAIIEEYAEEVISCPTAAAEWKTIF